MYELNWEQKSGVSVHDNPIPKLNQRSVIQGHHNLKGA